jgi:[acyl-carrier-protein] S-malonyltransferase
MFFQSAKKRDRHGDDRRQSHVDSEGKSLTRPRATIRPWLPAAVPAANGEVGAMAAGQGQAAVELRAGIGTAAFAFRGYDQTNLGRSPELLAHPTYGPIVREWLDEASRVSTETVGRPIDLVARVEAGVPSTLDSFAEDVATIVAIELAQLAIL